MSLYLANQPDPEAVMAALEREVIHAILLLEMRFASGTVYLSTEAMSYVDPLWGHTWAGLGALVSIDDVAGGPNELAPMRSYRLGVPWELLTTAERSQAEFGIIPALVTDRPEYVNRPAILWEQLLSDDVRDQHGRPTPVGVPSAIHFGLMDRAVASFSASAMSLTLSVEGPLARKGAPVWGRLTSRDQLRRHPGDQGLRYVPEVMSTNPVWTDW